MNIELLVLIGVLALADTLSPTTLGVTVYVLIREEEHFTSRLLVYLLVVATFYFTVGIMLMLGIDSIMRTFSGVKENTFLNQFILIIGIGLLIGSFFIPTKPRQKPQTPKNTKMITMVGLGLTTGLIEVGTALPYFAAIGMMLSAELTIEKWMTILLIYNFIMILPPLIIVILYSIFKKRLNKLLGKLSLIVEKWSGTTVSWLMFIVGLIIIINVV